MLPDRLRATIQKLPERLYIPGAGKTTRAEEQLAPLARAYRRRQAPDAPADDLVASLGDRLAEIEPRLAAKWISEKQLAQHAVVMAGHLLRDHRFGPAQSLMAAAHSLLEVRDEAVNSIIDNLEEVRREDLRQAVPEHHAALEKDLVTLQGALTKGYKERALFSRTLRRVTRALKGSREPEHELLYPVLVDLERSFAQVLNARTGRESARRRRDSEGALQAEKHIKKHYDAAHSALVLAQRRIGDAMGLYDFMVTYRGHFKGLRLAGWEEQPARGGAYERTLRDFLRERSIIRKMGARPSRDYQRWRIKTATKLCSCRRESVIPKRAAPGASTIRTSVRCRYTSSSATETTSKRC